MSNTTMNFRRHGQISIRMVVFGAIVLAMVGYPLYIYIDSEISGGVKSVAGGYKEVDLKAMSSFDFDQVNGRLQDVPQKWRDLNGQKVILYGEIAPTTFATRSLNEFDLVYSVQNCCFSGPPQIQHFIQSKLGTGKQAPYYTGLVKVTGTLRVDVKSTGGQISSVYRLDVDQVEKVS